LVITVINTLVDLLSRHPVSTTVYGKIRYDGQKLKRGKHDWACALESTREGGGAEERTA
jgi:hypothetical protein